MQRMQCQSLSSGLVSSKARACLQGKYCKAIVLAWDCDKALQHTHPMEIVQGRLQIVWKSARPKVEARWLLRFGSISRNAARLPEPSGAKDYTEGTQLEPSWLRPNDECVDVCGEKLGGKRRGKIIPRQKITQHVRETLLISVVSSIPH